MKLTRDCCLKDGLLYGFWGDDIKKHADECVGLSKKRF